MSLSNRSTSQDGFTIVELTIAIVLSAIGAIVIYTIFNTSFLNYLGLQQDSYTVDNLNRQAQRIATAVRGLTDITQASDADIKFYAYFSPNDSYVSFVHYYVSGTTKLSLLADVTPMTANPPTGTLITAKKQTFTIIQDFQAQPGKATFEYLDSSSAKLTQPIADLHTIKGMNINLAQTVKTTKSSYVYTSNLTVSLRNRKTNL